MPNLNTTVSQFIYSVEASYILFDQVYEIKSELISSIMVDNDYIKNNMPIIYCIMNLELDLYEKVINNNELGRFLFIIKNNRDGGFLSNSYIKSQFEYFIPNKRNNWNPDFTDVSASQEIANSGYKRIIVGLMSETIMNNNRKFFNGICDNTTSQSLAHKAIKDLNILFEPFHNNYNVNEFMVPPISTIAEFLEHLNAYYPFYNTPYIYYIDFNNAYLMSQNGNHIPNRNLHQKDIVNINIGSSFQSDDDEGMIVDDINGIYNINAQINATVLKIDKYLQARMNNIKGIDTDGKLESEPLEIEKMDSYTKYIYYRVLNLDTIDVIKKSIENSMAKLTVIKSNIDSTILTPNKNYIIKNFEANKQYDGKYILVRKIDVISHDTAGFSSSTTLILNRVI